MQLNGRNSSIYDADSPFAYTSHYSYPHQYYYWKALIDRSRAFVHLRVRQRMYRKPTRIGHGSGVEAPPQRNLRPPSSLGSRNGNRYSLRSDCTRSLYRHVPIQLLIYTIFQNHGSVPVMRSNSFSNQAQPPSQGVPHSTVIQKGTS